MDNDDLLDLEALIGRFNIFDALGIANAEVRHSNFLAWLLDPGESHGQGDLFLTGLLMDILSAAPAELRPFSPVEIDGEQLRGVEIRREWEHIDLLVVCREPSFVVAIENKVLSGEHSDQLARYENTIGSHFPEVPRMFVFLSAEEIEASQPDWVAYSYADLHRALSRVQRVARASIGDDVMTFLDHYLSLIGSRFMDDPKVDELCRRIYKNHRRAIDLINERAGSPLAPLRDAIYEVISEPDSGYCLTRKHPSWISFMPASWLEVLPAIAQSKTRDPRNWLTFSIGIDEEGISLSLWIVGTTDTQPRDLVAQALSEHRAELMLNPSPRAKPPFRNAPLLREQVCRWSDPGEADIDAVKSDVRRALAANRERSAAIEKLLRSVLSTSR